jgi:hypothetical protein
MKSHDFVQDLLFLNLPDSNKTVQDKLKFLGSLKKKSPIFKQINAPCFIYTGNGRIEKLERLKFRPKTRNKIKNKPIYIFLYEPICIEIYGKLNCGFYSDFKYPIEHYHHVSVQELDSIRIFIANNQLRDVMIFTTECNVERLKPLYPDLNIRCWDVFIHHICVEGRAESKLPNRILKPFWCGNWRYTLHRHIVMSYLTKYEGNYSWNYHVNFKVIKKNYWFDFKYVKTHYDQKYQEIRKGIENLNKHSLELVPSEFKTQVKISFLAATCYPAKHNSNKSKESVLDSYKDCFCAVINETRFAQPFGGFSEKTLDPIISRLPFVLVAPPKTLKHLKTFGFKTFDRWWDESYDDEEDHMLRLLKILDVIDSIGQKSLSELSKIYSEMVDILEHNRSIVLNFASRQMIR